MVKQRHTLWRGRKSLQSMRRSIFNIICKDNALLCTLTMQSLKLAKPLLAVWPKLQRDVWRTVWESMSGHLWTKIIYHHLKVSEFLQVRNLFSGPEKRLHTWRNSLTFNHNHSCGLNIGYVNSTASNLYPSTRHAQTLCQSLPPRGWLESPI